MAYGRGWPKAGYLPLTDEFSCRLGSIFFFNILGKNIITELDLFSDDEDTIYLRAV